MYSGVLIVLPCGLLKRLKKSESCGLSAVCAASAGDFSELFYNLDALSPAGVWRAARTDVPTQRSLQRRPLLSGIFYQWQGFSRSKEFLSFRDPSHTKSGIRNFTWSNKEETRQQPKNTTAKTGELPARFLIGYIPFNSIPHNSRSPGSGFPTHEDFWLIWSEPIIEKNALLTHIRPRENLTRPKRHKIIGLLPSLVRKRGENRNRI